jgi:uncharacterized protein
MAFGRYAKCTAKGTGGIDLSDKQREAVFLVSVLLPDGKVKEFRTDELDELKTLDRFHKIYGESNLIITRTQVI